MLPFVTISTTHLKKPKVRYSKRPILHVSLHQAKDEGSYLRRIPPVVDHRLVSGGVLEEKFEFEWTGEEEGAWVEMEEDETLNGILSSELQEKTVFDKIYVYEDPCLIRDYTHLVEITLETKYRSSFSWNRFQSDWVKEDDNGFIAKNETILYQEEAIKEQLDILQKPIVVELNWFEEILEPLQKEELTVLPEPHDNVISTIAISKNINLLLPAFPEFDNPYRLHEQSHESIVQSPKSGSQENYFENLLQVTNRGTTGQVIDMKRDIDSMEMDFLDINMVLQGRSIRSNDNLAPWFHNVAQLDIPWNESKPLFSSSFRELFPSFHQESYAYIDPSHTEQFIDTRILDSLHAFNNHPFRPLSCILTEYWKEPPVVLRRVKTKFDAEYFGSFTPLNAIEPPLQQIHQTDSLFEFVSAATEPAIDLETISTVTESSSETNSIVPNMPGSTALKEPMVGSKLSTGIFEIIQKVSDGNVDDPNTVSGASRKDCSDFNEIQIESESVEEKATNNFNFVDQPTLQALSTISSKPNMILVAEDIFENNFSIFRNLESQFGIKAIDYPFRDPADIVISEISCIKLIWDLPALDQPYIKRDFVKGLCMLCLKFPVIWILIRSDSHAGDEHASRMVSLAQSFMRFPSRVILREFTDSTISSIITSICEDDLFVSNQDPRTLSQYYGHQHCLPLMERSKVSAACDFLQQYPSINICLASLLFAAFLSLKDLVSATPETMKEQLESVCPSSKLDYITPNLLSFAILLRTKMN